MVRIIGIIANAGLFLYFLSKNYYDKIYTIIG
jgi:hypothetical protein